MPKDVKIVLFSGAGGGLVSWAFTLATTGSTFGLGRWEALPLCVILGAAAALIAVYVVTPADVTKTGKLIAFSVLCGLLWKPVLDSGKAVFTEQLPAAAKDDMVKTDVKELRQADSPGAVATKANELAESTSELLRASERIDNPNLNENAKDAAKEAIAGIAATSTANPVAASIALDQIRIAAQDSHHNDIATLATDRITAIDRAVSPTISPLLPSEKQ
jgi:hypothetical protein